MTLLRSKTFLVIAVLLTVVIVTQVDEISRPPGDESDGRRAAIVTITWQPAPGREPGYIEVTGHVGSTPAHAPRTSENPFVVSGIVHGPDEVDVQAYALDGPFVKFTCKVDGTGYRMETLPGRRVRCFGT